DNSSPLRSPPESERQSRRPRRRQSAGYVPWLRGDHRASPSLLPVPPALSHHDPGIVLPSLRVRVTACDEARPAERHEVTLLVLVSRSEYSSVHRNWPNHSPFDTLLATNHTERHSPTVVRHLHVETVYLESVLTVLWL